MSTSIDGHRSHEIDGIRGWAAFAVLLFHLIHETFGSIFPWSRHPVAFALLNGPLAVFVFFVLSGDALSIGHIQTRARRTLDSLAVRRYFRLTIPIALSTGVLLVLMSTGLVFNRAAGQLVQSDWLGAFLNFDASIASYLRYVLIEVYSPTKVYGAPATPYNPMLWTMPVELAGSVLVLLFWYLSPGLKSERRVLVGVTLALAVLGSYYALFFVGMTYSTLRSSGTLARLRADARWQLLALPLFVAALLGHGALGNQAGVRHLSILSAAVIVFCAYTSRPLLSMFRSRLSIFLGDVSFPLYLIHLAVLVSLTSWWIVASAPVSPIDAAWICIGSIFVCLVVSAGFRAIERRVLRVVDKRLLLLIEPKLTPVEERSPT